MPLRLVSPGPSLLARRQTISPARFAKCTKNSDVGRVFGIAIFPVPLHVENETGSAHPGDGLDSPVLGHSLDRQTGSDPINRLAVPRVHRLPGRADDPRESACH